MIDLTLVEFWGRGIRAHAYERKATVDLPRRRGAAAAGIPVGTTHEGKASTPTSYFTPGCFRCGSCAHRINLGKRSRLSSPSPVVPLFEEAHLEVRWTPNRAQSYRVVESEVGVVFVLASYIVWSCGTCCSCSSLRARSRSSSRRHGWRAWPRRTSFDRSVPSTGEGKKK